MTDRPPSRRPQPGRPAPSAEDPRWVEVLQPPGGVSYPLVLRGAGYTAWRSVLGVVLALSLYVLVTPLVSSVVLGSGYLLQQPAGSGAAYRDAGVQMAHPVGMLAQNLAIAALAPVAWFVVFVVHRVRPRWLSSVQPGLRWRYLVACAAAAVVVFTVVLVVTTRLGPDVAFRPQPRVWGFLVVIVLTAPLQAAAEEYLFRGYLLQALGSLVARPWFGVVLSALVFAAFHGAQNLPLFLNRLAFGLLAAVLVWRSGGLEAGIAAHVANNLFAYTFAALTSSVASLRGTTQIGWGSAALDVAGFAVFTVVALLLARRVQTVTPATGVTLGGGR